VLSVAPQERDAFLSGLAARINVSSGKSLLLFVHGFNISFEDAARRTAQMTYDLGFDGAPLFYSWPSRAMPGSYVADETNVEWTLHDLRGLLVDIAESTPAENIFLIAHGMGNRALARAFASIIEARPELKKKFTEIILIAPDIDADVFRRDIAPAITAAIPSAVTLYASSRDNALQLSHGLHEYPRLGDTSSGVVVLPGMDTIDATDVDSDFPGHSYFGESASVVADMFYLIREGKRPPQRFGLMPVDAPAGRFWKFRKTQ
jgi:esterase/lipase superfamily enzyme